MERLDPSFTGNSYSTMNKGNKLFMSQEKINEKWIKERTIRISRRDVHPNVTKGRNEALWGSRSRGNDKIIPKYLQGCHECQTRSRRYWTRYVNQGRNPAGDGRVKPYKGK